MTKTSERHNKNKRQFKKYNVGNDKLMTVKEIADATNLSEITIRVRLVNGVEGEALLKPDYRKTNVGKKYDVGEDKEMTVREIAEYTNLNIQTIYHRIKKGISGKDLLLIKNKKA